MGLFQVQERSTFNEMISRLQKKIAANKKTIADITELAIQAFDQRDECQSKIQALQERNEKDAQQYAAELKVYWFTGSLTRFQIDWSRLHLNGIPFFLVQPSSVQSLWCNINLVKAERAFFFPFITSVS